MTDLEELLEQHEDTRRWLAREARADRHLQVPSPEAELEQLRKLAEPTDLSALLGDTRPRHPAPEW